MSEKNSHLIVSDLFGDVVTLPSGRRGRPAHRWSKSNADKVILGKAGGYADEDIAKGLGVSLPTLRKYYFSELSQQGQRIRFDFWRMHNLAEQANGGNVGAMKELGKMMEKRDRHLAEKEFRDGKTDREEPVGKKEAARRAAEGQATGDPDLTPGLWH